MQVPSVGNIVHYVAYGTPNGEYAGGAHRAAMITDLVEYDDNWVSLVVFNPTGLHFVQEIPYSDGHEPGTWHWPEYVPAVDAEVKQDEYSKACCQAQAIADEQLVILKNQLRAELLAELLELQREENLCPACRGYGACLRQFGLACQRSNHPERHQSGQCPCGLASCGCRCGRCGH